MKQPPLAWIVPFARERRPSISFRAAPVIAAQSTVKLLERLAINAGDSGTVLVDNVFRHH